MSSRGRVLLVDHPVPELTPLTRDPWHARVRPSLRLDASSPAVLERIDPE